MSYVDKYTYGRQYKKRFESKRDAFYSGYDDAIFMYSGYDIGDITSSLLSFKGAFAETASEAVDDAVDDAYYL